ncbi:MAG: hypothetical protein ABIA04_01895 [Pseudomonadota bacterium]
MHKNDFKKITKKLFHDINKPIINAYMVISTCYKLMNKLSSNGLNDLLSEQFTELRRITQKQSLKLENIYDVLNQQETKYLESTYKRYTSQFSFLNDLITNNNFDNLLSEELINKLSSIDKENTKFALNIIKSINDDV